MAYGLYTGRFGPEHWDEWRPPKFRWVVSFKVEQRRRINVIFDNASQAKEYAAALNPELKPIITIEKSSWRGKKVI